MANKYIYTYQKIQTYKKINYFKQILLYLFTIFNNGFNFKMGCCGSNEGEDDIELNTSKPIVIFVIGAPGTGKTIQCKKFEKEYDFKIISITDILSKIVTQDQKGVLISILKDELTKTPKPITLIDGYPRNENDLAEWNRFKL